MFYAELSDEQSVSDSLRHKFAVPHAAFTRKDPRDLATVSRMDPQS